MDQFHAHLYFILFGWSMVLVGVLLQRYNEANGGRKQHRRCQVAGLLFITLGWYFGTRISSGQAVWHSLIGTLAVLCALLQGFAGYCLKFGWTACLTRAAAQQRFSEIHPWVGRCVIFLVAINIAIGVQLGGYKQSVYMVMLVALSILIFTLEWRIDPRRTKRQVNLGDSEADLSLGLGQHLLP
eukprot:gb/GEZN01014408.1/.p1 GENE.gb/GEZN01014408.1/~~gb/GEZN01014408.1/.p1  ORF type:complete len:184 (-),score=10.95 gb/GEZN01014408.1/:245-796(-)